ncbi:MAG: hypothetical protein H7066_17880 [Cytophagaceae bacterium]|nr:hypothetical protein [Gemmatimonadaceae bacterium]
MTTKDHVVARGEYLALIANRNGFRDYRSIWNDPANAELRKLRTNPQSLAPGDVVRIPVIDPGTFARATNQTHLITAGGGPMRIELRLDDQSHAPFATRNGQLTVTLRPNSGTAGVAGPVPRQTGSAGELAANSTSEFVDGEFKITPLDPANASSGATFRFLVGELEPVDTPRGMRARLSNLGYFAGASDKDADQLEWAMEEFQADEKIPKAQRGFFNGERGRLLPTLNALGKKHGDMLPGEELK